MLTSTANFTPGANVDATSGGGSGSAMVMALHIPFKVEEDSTA